VKRCFRAALAVGALAGLLPGCGSGDRGTAAGPAVPSANRRIMADERYKDLIGKDGKPIWTPGKPMRPPSK
jgi:hypothetical protein